MTGDAIVRRLTAIMFTDVVGYSKLMSTDEQRALELLRRQRELFTSLIAAHNGTLHKEIGDGTLSSFDSAVDALRCARAIHAALATLGPDETFGVRIGLHTGDVVFEGNDVFGDGVNVASRIEALAPSGGVALSGSFYGAVRSQRDLTVHSLGEQALKNIANPVPVFVLGEAPIAAPRRLAATARWPFRVSAAAVFLAVVAVVWLRIDKLPHDGDTPAARSPGAASSSAPVGRTEVPVSDRSIAVLPFADMSQSKDQEYFSDGMSEELLNLLAQVHDLKVIARTSSFAFRGKDVPIAEIAKQLNVAHVLEGSVRKSGNTVRITAQLIRTADSVHLWSEAYDRPLDDIFKVQDEIANAIVQALQIKLAGGELSRRKGGTQNSEAYQLYLRANGAAKLNTRAAADSVKEYLEQAVKLDPNYGLAWSFLADNAGFMASSGWVPPTEGFERSRELVRHALQLSPDSALIHAQLQQIYQSYDWDWPDAEAESLRALALDPGDFGALNAAGGLYGILGRWGESERAFRAALVRDPLNSYVMWNLGVNFYGSGRFVEAEETYRKVIEMTPDFLWVRGYLAKALLAQGKAEAALAMVQQNPNPEERLAYLPVVLHAVGRNAEADAALQALIDQAGDRGAYGVARIYAYRGDPDLAMQWLERAYKQKDPALPEILGELLFKNIARDPRFIAFLKKMNLPTEPVPVNWQ